MGFHELRTEVEIDASADRVWAILADFASYPEWNPFIRSIRGPLTGGARLIVRIQPSGGRGMTVRPIVLAANVGRELRWRGRLACSCIFSGEHEFVIEPISEGKVRFRQNERFRGWLVRFVTKSLDRDTKNGFEEMNLALKARAESIDAM
jgi:hypothetical protein